MARKKRVLRGPRIIICIVVLLSLISGGIFLYMTRTSPLEEAKKSVLDTIDEKVLQNNVDESFDLKYELKDYGIYGETLLFYEEPYGETDKNSLVGSMVLLRNVETEEESTYILGESIDSGIRLNSLDEGLYEVYIYDQYEKKRVYFDDEIESDSLRTMRDAKTVKEVRLVANQDYLSDHDIKMDENYAFLEIKDTLPEVDVIDIVLDPGGNVYNELTMEQEGIQTEYIDEATEMYAFAQLVQEKLEAKGVHASLSRDADASVSYYGTDSRVGVGYEGNAKAFVTFSVYQDETYDRPYFLASRFSSGLFASEIAYAFQGADLEMSMVNETNSMMASVGFDSGIVEDEEGQNAQTYDAYPSLRETGGKQTFAGKASWAQANSSYSQRNGMEALILFLANADKEESVRYYQEHKEELADQVAKGILLYYGIQGEESETADQ